MGFRHDPNTGGGRNIREQLDMVDVGIYDLGGIAPMYKFCMGVLLFNESVHKLIAQSLDDIIDLMYKFTTNKFFVPIPNRPEYALNTSPALVPKDNWLLLWS